MGFDRQYECAALTTEPRIVRAIVIANPQLSLIKIALALGYVNQNTVGQAFLKVADMTPCERRRARLS